LEEIKTYIRNGEKLMAVKIFKDYTSEGLRQSKDFIDFLINYMKYS